jgi:hypothetical protein
VKYGETQKESFFYRILSDKQNFILVRNFLLRFVMKWKILVTYKKRSMKEEKKFFHFTLNLHFSFVWNDIYLFVSYAINRCLKARLNSFFPQHIYFHCTMKLNKRRRKKELLSSQSFILMWITIQIVTFWTPMRYRSAKQWERNYMVCIVVKWMRMWGKKNGCWDERLKKQCLALEEIFLL